MSFWVFRKLHSFCSNLTSFILNKDPTNGPYRRLRLLVVNLRESQLWSLAVGCVYALLWLRLNKWTAVWWHANFGRVSLKYSLLSAKKLLITNEVCLLYQSLMDRFRQKTSQLTTLWCMRFIFEGSGKAHRFNKDNEHSGVWRDHVIELLRENKGKKKETTKGFLLLLRKVNDESCVGSVFEDHMWLRVINFNRGVGVGGVGLVVQHDDAYTDAYTNAHI